MANYSRGEVILVRYPFSDLSGSKVRPAVVVSTTHIFEDLFIVPLTSKISPLLPGEFVLSEWGTAGLHVPSALKRGLYTIRKDLVMKSVGILSQKDRVALESSLCGWLGIKGC